MCISHDLRAQKDELYPHLALHPFSGPKSTTRVSGFGGVERGAGHNAPSLKQAEPVTRDPGLHLRPLLAAPLGACAHKPARFSGENPLCMESTKGDPSWWTSCRGFIVNQPLSSPASADRDGTDHRCPFGLEAW